MASRHPGPQKQTPQGQQARVRQRQPSYPPPPPPRAPNVLVAQKGCNSLVTFPHGDPNGFEAEDRLP